MWTPILIVAVGVVGILVLPSWILGPIMVAGLLLGMLLIPLVFLGLIAWTQAERRAGVTWSSDFRALKAWWRK